MSAAPISRRFALGTLAIALLIFTASAQAAKPLITQTSFSGVTDSTATLQASVDPNGAKVLARFQYTTQADFAANGFGGPLTASTPEVEVPREVTSTGKVTSASPLITGVSSPAPGNFGPGQTLAKTTGFPSGATIEKVSTEAGTNLLEIEVSAAATATASRVTLKATGPQPISAQISGLTPGSAYRFRATAHNTKASPEEGTGPDVPFFTLAPPPTYEPCPNDAFRSGELSPFGSPGALLPDCRSYEQATPVDKNGNNALNLPSFTKAAADGSAVTFGATFGVPGGEGAQVFPYYLASRGAEEGGWSTSGLQPPANLGEQARPLIGWLPDFEASYAQVERLGDPNLSALYELHADGTEPTQIAPYSVLPEENILQSYGVAGVTDDSSRVVLQAWNALAPKEGQPPIAAAVSNSPNVYAWDRATGALRLASVLNDGASPPKGAYAGPYNWAGPGQGLRSGGPSASYYLREQRAVSNDGSVFFTSASDGHLYQRINPTAEQSQIEGDHCAEPELACTIDISATRKTNGGPNQGGPDPAGTQPAAFMAASADGKTAYFTSSEKLTNDANTGPEQPPARIGAADLSNPDPDATKEEDFLPTHAIGVAVDPAGEYLYWDEPSLGTIGRAKLRADGSGIEGASEPSFIDPGKTEAITLPISEPSVYHSAPSRPRYIAVGPCAEGGECIYWTNTGPPQGEEANGIRPGSPIIGGGTIGRARISGSGAESVKPDFIIGATNPQGIAVNSSHIYWANAGEHTETRSIGRAALDGGDVIQDFIQVLEGFRPYGVGLTETGIYYSVNEEGADHGSIRLLPLDGNPDNEDFLFIGKEGIRGITADSEHIYWATQGEEAVGRADLALTAGSRENRFIGIEGKPSDLAFAGSQILWSSNGESRPNPGNDLYEFNAAGSNGCIQGDGCLSDLTVDETGNGAEVQGVLGTSANGGYVYFAANGDLDDSGPAERGDCHFAEGVTGTTGSCSIYLYHEGNVRVIAPVDLSGAGELTTEALNWTPMLLNNRNSAAPKTAAVSDDGKTLIFLSRKELLNNRGSGVSELYRFHYGDPEQLRCISCPPSGGLPVGQGVTLGSNSFPQKPREEGVSAFSTRFLAANGNRAFFESSDALSLSDSNALGGCPLTAKGPRCLDVYEWEAPGTGSCKEGGPGWSPLNRGCIYLISSGRSDEPSLFADASESGDDVYFFTDDQLVRQDTDSLYDVYDARVDGGLASQNLFPRQCEGNSCKPGATPPPPYIAPPDVTGPPDPKPKRCTKGKKCKHHKKKHKHRKHRSNPRHGGKK